MTLEQRLAALVPAIAADIKTLTANGGNLASLTTTAKTSLVAAINELQSEVNAVTGGAAINDAATNGNTTQTWSADKIFDELIALKNSILNGVGPAYDTLQELAAGLTGQDTAVSNLTTAVGNRVRFDAAQALTGPQQVQARANIGAQEAAAIGNPDADLALIYTNAKV